MKEYIQQFFEICTPEIKLATDLIMGLCEGRKVSGAALAYYVSSNASIKSKQRRIERFYHKGHIEPSYLLAAIKNIFGKEKFTLAFDRTNWKYGTKSINAFVAFAFRGEVGSLLNLKMLANKGGNSKTQDRIEMAKAVIEKYGKENIKSILGDREFFSIEFANWLHANDLPYAIRVKENLDFVQPYLASGTKKGKMFKNILIENFNGVELRGDLSVKKLDGEYLILVSRKVNNPLKEYRQRWSIERFFKMLKTGGLNIESMKMVDLKRIEILFLLCAVAYLICVKMGLYRHQKVKAIRKKVKYKCREYSYFRWGIDWLTELIMQGADIIKRLVCQILPVLQPGCRGVCLILYNSSNKVYY
ncbi:MAG: transposase, family [Candidatus Midichloriaceae bacterium]|jgi:hypothetical protein|nr:transposase, family [Candidatus Midichloriaceae bacterium]